MVTPVLETKTHRPRPRQSLVPRPKLIELLDLGLSQGRQLTLVCAPAGSGKTTLLAEWLHGVDRPSAWLSLDEGDNDPARFMTYLTHSLQKIDEQMLQTLQEMLKTSQLAPLEPILTTLVNAIAQKSDPFILVLDDFHTITNQAIFDVLEFMLSYPPENLHLVFSSRMDPPLAINRLRAQGLLTEVRMPELRYTRHEMLVFLNDIMGLSLSEEDIAVLESCTEGWAVGVQLAALSIQQHTNRREFIAHFTGAHRFITDYLIDEVTSQLSNGMRDFLQETSILERFSPALCDAVTERTDGNRILHDLEQSNLFLVPLDDVRVWYRYHHLFSEFLQQHLFEMNPAAIPVLHSRASTWYQQNGCFREAINHAFAGGDMERAACLVEEYAPQFLLQGQANTALKWFSAFPEEILCLHPHLGLHYATALSLVGRLAEVGPYLESAQAALTKQKLAGDTSGVFEFEGELQVLRTLLLHAQGNLASGIELARDTLQRVPDDNLFAQGAVLSLLGGLLEDEGDIVQAEQVYSEAIRLLRGDGQSSLLEIVCHYRLAQILVLQAKLHQAVEICRQALKPLEEPASESNQILLITGLIHRTLGAVLYEWNELEAAESELREGFRYEQLSGYHYYQDSFEGLLGLVLHALGRTDSQVGMPGEHNESQCMMPIWWLEGFERQDTVYQVRLAILRGEIGEGIRWANEIDRSESGRDDCQNEMSTISMVRVLVASGYVDHRTKDWEQALELLVPLLHAAESNSQVDRLVTLTALEALALQGLQHLDQAIDSLHRSLELGAPENYIRTYIEFGAPMFRLLRQTEQRRIMPSYVREILSALNECHPKSESPQLGFPEVEPLTEREVEIVRLIGAGLSNPEIAIELCLSVNTIKWYTTRIFNKLGVSRRAQAVDRAHELGIL